ncbi:MAG: hypothetical protein K6C05_03770 [Anaerovibrio sp.]|uniref:hypothetical protein n=1 Tax=Anaerovibrio sp. TaxID=1872532 RepID=UPI0025FE927C|nr:hypothetical protein [Anaerovibrio sp.]MCR5175949.1 hypothetical protein [Anaerovibrio sp.]
MMIITYAVLAAIIHLIGAYCRFLPFKEKLTPDLITKIWKRYNIWAITDCILISFLLMKLGINYSSYKLIFFIGWIPYVLITLYYIKHKIPEHLFVYGIQALYAFMLHSFANMIISSLFGENNVELLHIHLILWILIFALTLPWTKKLFSSLLPDNLFFSDTTLRWLIALLPISIYLGTSMNIINITFLPSWEERLSRLTIPIIFFILYSVIQFNSYEISKKQELTHNNSVMLHQLRYLKRQNQLIQENEERLSVLRHDLRHSYRIIYTLLEEGKDDSIKQHIISQTKMLKKMLRVPVSPIPLIDSLLKTYEKLAKEHRVTIHKDISVISLEPSTERDLSLLLSKLLQLILTKAPSKLNNFVDVNMQEESPGVSILLKCNFPFFDSYQTSEIQFLDTFIQKYDANLATKNDNNWYQLIIKWDSSNRNSQFDT